MIEATRKTLQDIVRNASEALKVFPRGEFGLTPDAVKFSPEYRAAKAEYDRAFGNLRAFNTKFKPPSSRARG